MRNENTETLFADVQSAVATGRPIPTSSSPQALAQRIDNATLDEAERLLLTGHVVLLSHLSSEAATRATPYLRALRVSEPDVRVLHSDLTKVTQGLSIQAVLQGLPQTVSQVIDDWVISLALRLEPVPLLGLEAQAFAHPRDRQSLALIRSLPGVERFYPRFLDSTRSRFEQLRHQANAVEVTTRTASALRKTFDECCDILDVKPRPRLFMEAAGSSAYTLGADEPLIVVSQIAIDRLPPLGQRFLLGHELGHVKARHYPYHQFAQAIEDLGTRAASWSLGLTNALKAPLMAPLAAWRRYSELTADRAGYLACQDRETALRAMMTLSGLSPRHAQTTDVAAYVEQAREHAANLGRSSLQRLLTVEAQLTQTHPQMSERLLELLDWVADGSYDELLTASPERRHQIARRSSLFGDAADELLVQTAVRALQEWAAAMLRLPRAEVGPAVRTLVLDGQRPVGSPLERVLQITLRVERMEFSACRFRLEVWVAAGSGAVVHTIALPIGGDWETLPKSTRRELIRHGGQVADRPLFPRREGT